MSIGETMKAHLSFGKERNGKMMRTDDAIRDFHVWDEEMRARAPKYSSQKCTCCECEITTDKCLFLPKDDKTPYDQYICDSCVEDNRNRMVKAGCEDWAIDSFDWFVESNKEYTPEKEVEPDIDWDAIIHINDDFEESINQLNGLLEVVA